MKTALEDVRFMAKHYRIRGNMRNGHSGRDENGNPIPFIHPADYTRRISSVNRASFNGAPNGLVFCECGRQFLIDDALSLEEMSW
jgi:hypothetical protein